jgi:hypothetical protein
MAITGHSSLKASLNIFNIVSTAECECDDRLQTEEHALGGHELYEDQKGTAMMDIRILFEREREKNTQSQLQSS